ncbi:MAG: hypothetical protein AB4372_29945 [Xenococcus sp. (in: cyanobacteria)]
MKAEELDQKLSQKQLKSVRETSSQLTISQRRDFLKLPIAERRRILAQQAAELSEHYQKDTEWREWVEGDIIEY